MIFLILTVGMVSCGSAKEESKTKEKTIVENKVKKKVETEIQNKKATILSVDEFEKQILNEGTILDVRTPGEVAEGIIANAKVFDFNGADFSKQIQTLDKTKPVYVYCKAGGRSGKASKMLIDLGYEVYDLEGGMDAWIAAGKSVTK